MSEITPKSPELIQAQVATFAAEYIEHPVDRAHILNNLSGLAVGNAVDVTRLSEVSEYRADEVGDLSVQAPEGTEIPVANTAEYTDFLRFVGGSKYEAITGRADMLTQYKDTFQPQVHGLLDELQDPATDKEHPAFLGSGSNSIAFRISHGDKDYAVRIPKNRRPSPVTIDSHLAGAVLGKGIPHLEQVVAASYEDGVTISEIMPGKEMGKDMTVDDIKGITDEQLTELVDTVVGASKSGIEIDPKPANIFYDSEKGFGIIDYGALITNGDAAGQTTGSIVGSLSGPIMNAGFYGSENKDNATVDDYARDLAFRSADMAVLQRYRTIVESKLSGDDQHTALEYIDHSARRWQGYLDKYSNPDWVAEQVASMALV